MINKLREIKYYLINRFINKPHYLHTGLTKGHYHEIDERMLHGMFETLVDFIEVEKAWMQAINDNIHIPWYKRFTFRDPALGLKHLDWEMELTEYGSEAQAASAREQKELYIWWKQIRPSRPDPFNAYYDLVNSTEDYFGVETEGGWKARELAFSTEDQYRDSDTQMLIRLVKIRSHLWT